MKPSSALALFVATLGAAATGHAQSVSPVPAPTIITTAPYTISAPGYYQLGKDLTYNGNGATNDAIITIAASNVTLDFGGHYISGPSNGNTSGSLFGIVANEKGNLIIENGTVANCYEGIVFYGNGSANSIAVNLTVRNMLVTYCGHIGVNFFDVLYSRVTDSVVSNTGGANPTNGTGNYALYLDGIANSFARNSLIKVAGPSSTATLAYAAYVPSGSNAFAVGNQIYGSYYGLYADGALKYEANLTYGCSTAFTGGTSVGYDNN